MYYFDIISEAVYAVSLLVLAWALIGLVD
jgi:hypothetical protein